MVHKPGPKEIARREMRERWYNDKHKEPTQRQTVKSNTVKKRKRDQQR